MELNVLGNEIEVCGCNPMTGWLRDGFCNTDFEDQGIHTVCAVVTEEFLTFSKEAGNDLSTPKPDFGFPGLKAGDHWCLCAGSRHHQCCQSIAQQFFLPAHRGSRVLAAL